MLNFVGDINLSDNAFDVGVGIGSKISKGYDPFSKIKRKAKDIWIGNFEGVSSSNTLNKGTASRQFNLNPVFLTKIQHFDIYNVANNHSMEHGSDAFNQTVQNLKAVGAQVFGMNESRTIILEYGGKSFSITSFSQRKENTKYVPLYWYNPDISDLKHEYDKVAHIDFKILYIHWGNEFINRPYNDQRLFAHSLIDLGFDLIIGMHPHILQGYEIYNNKRIYYSIGNFVFNMGWEPLQYGAIVHIDTHDDGFIVTHSYVHIESDYFPLIVPKMQVPEKYRFEHLNKLIRYDLSNEEYYSLLFKNQKKYRLSNRFAILKGFCKMNPKDSLSIIIDFLKRQF